MSVDFVKKVHGGYKVDDLELLAGNCGCGGMTGSGYVTGDCCQTYSRVKRDGNVVTFIGKFTTPNTKDNYEWGYRVKKGDTEVDVRVYDTRQEKRFQVGGHYPPQLMAFKGRGWEVVSEFERPVEGPGEPLPEWCLSAEVCERPVREIESPKGDMPRVH